MVVERYAMKTPGELKTWSSEPVPEVKTGRMKDGFWQQAKGINWIVAGFMVVCDMAGGGIIALPTAVQLSHFPIGILLCGFVALVGLSNAIFLGKSLCILQREFPEYRTHCRKPYAAMGLRAFGSKMGSLVSISLTVTQGGISTVFLLLTARNFSDFLATLSPNAPGMCWTILIVAAIVLPITMLRSPQDFWWLIMAGAAATAFAVVLLVFGGLADFSTCAPTAVSPAFRVANLFSAIGTVSFTFGGHTAFPTIGVDMRKPRDFTRASILAFSIVCLFYMPVVFIGHFTYGSSLRDSMVNSIQTAWIQRAVNLLIAAHCFNTLVLMITPLSLEAEEVLKVPYSFSAKRVAVRTCVLATIVFIGETVPTFGPVLNLIGASTVTLTCFILPSIFYIMLSARSRKMHEQNDRTAICTVREAIKMSNPRLLLLSFVIIAVGVVAAIAGSYTAAVEIFSTRFERPCYLKWLFSTSEPHATSTLNCCGAYQNVSWSDEMQCNAYHDFYHIS